MYQMKSVDTSAQCNVCGNTDLTERSGKRQGHFKKRKTIIARWPLFALSLVLFFTVVERALKNLIYFYWKVILVAMYECINREQSKCGALPMLNGLELWLLTLCLQVNIFLLKD